MAPAVGSGCAVGPALLLLLCVPSHHGASRVVPLVAVLGEVGEPKPDSVLFVVGPDKAFPVTAAATHAEPAEGSPRLHAHPRLEARDHIGAGGIAGPVAAHRLSAVGVAAAQVEQVDAGEGDEEAGQQREGVHGIGGVETAEEDEGGAESGGGEGHVIQRVDTVV